MVVKIELDCFDRGAISAILELKVKEGLTGLDRPRQLKYREITKHMGNFNKKVCLVIEDVKK